MAALGYGAYKAYKGWRTGQKDRVALNRSA